MVAHWAHFRGVTSRPRSAPGKRSAARARSGGSATGRNAMRSAGTRPSARVRGPTMQDELLDSTWAARFASARPAAHPVCRAARQPAACPPSRSRWRSTCRARLGRVDAAPARRSRAAGGRPHRMSLPPIRWTGSRGQRHRAARCARSPRTSRRAEPGSSRTRRSTARRGRARSGQRPRSAGRAHLGHHGEQLPDARPLRRRGATR